MVLTPRAVALVIDPDVICQHQFAMALRPRYNVFQADDVPQAIRAHLRYRPTLILLELDTPHDEGLAFIRMLREDVLFTHTAIACVSTCATTRMKVQAFQAGADTYLVKPVNLATLLGHMLLLLRVRALTR